MEPKERMLVFDYQAARLIIGIIAFTLPFAVSAFAGWKPLPSISDSYYTDARDALVGMLFIVGSFLFAYKGHYVNQGRASRIASIAAILAALCPTKCPTCNWNDPIAIVHICSATTLFLILAYFCLGPFSQSAQEKINKINKKAGRRKIIYQICGYIMIVCMGIMVINAVLTILFKIETGTLGITFWGEAVSLAAFGTAWMTASKPIKFLAEEGEKLVLFKKELKVGS